jgi:hypothetical protein
MSSFEKEELLELFQEAISRELGFLRDFTVSRKQAARIIGVTERTISNYKDIGKLDPIFVGNIAEYRLSDVLSIRKIHHGSWL